jgi:hypothetical protein
MLWHLLEAGPRQVLRDDLRCGDLEWERGRAWALEQAMGLVWYYLESNPDMSRLGRRTLQRIMADKSSSSAWVRRWRIRRRPSSWVPPPGAAGVAAPVYEAKRVILAVYGQDGRWRRAVAGVG